MDFKEKLKKLRDKKAMIGIKNGELIFGGFIASIEEDSITFWGRQKTSDLFSDQWGYDIGFFSFGKTPPLKMTTLISNISIFDIEELEKRDLRKFFKKQKLPL